MVTQFERKSRLSLQGHKMKSDLKHKKVGTNKQIVPLQSAQDGHHAEEYVICGGNQDVSEIYEEFSWE